MNITLLAAKFQRLKLAFGLLESLMLQASYSYLDAKAIATLTYLHNGKLDYPCLLYTSPSPRDMRRSRMPSSA